MGKIKAKQSKDLKQFLKPRALFYLSFQDVDHLAVVEGIHVIIFVISSDTGLKGNGDEGESIIYEPFTFLYISMHFCKIMQTFYLCLCLET